MNDPIASIHFDEDKIYRKPHASKPGQSKCE